MAVSGLQIFLLADTFIAGALATVAIRHGYAHFRPEVHEPEPVAAPHAQHTAAAKLPPALRERMVAEAEAKYRTILERSAGELEHEFSSTAEQINRHARALAKEIVDKQLSQYRDELAKLRQETVDSLGGVEEEVAKHRAEQLEAAEAEVKSEKDLLIKQLDAKLGDAVSAFLLETLEHNIDLGAQAPYLMKMLDEHKDELSKGLRDEA